MQTKPKQLHEDFPLRFRRLWMREIPLLINGSEQIARHLEEQRNGQSAWLKKSDSAGKRHKLF
jgi:hypothetical protein